MNPKEKAREIFDKMYSTEDVMLQNIILQVVF